MGNIITTYKEIDKLIYGCILFPLATAAVSVHHMCSAPNQALACSGMSLQAEIVSQQFLKFY